MYKLTKNVWIYRPLFLLVVIFSVMFFNPTTQADEIVVQAMPQPVETETSKIEIKTPISKPETQVVQLESKIKGLSLKIDAIGLNIPLSKTTLGKNKELLVPSNPNQAAWYKSGPIPGNNGTALITGHYDANGGVAGVFYKLDRLAVGDIIRVGREDGTIAVFQVDQLASYKQDHTFPWNKVYRSSGSPALRIITCDGTYNPKTGRYSHNLVVYASLVSIES